MIRSVLVALVFVAASWAPAAAQERLALDSEFVCAAEPSEIQEVAWLFDPTAAASGVLRDIVGSLGLSATGIHLKLSNVPNALATLDSLTNRRLILYNEEFLDRLKADSESAWTVRAILAHEVAHHLNGHLQTSGEEARMGEELEADRFAGHVLQRMGADLNAVTLVFENLGAGGSYPPKSARSIAARSGWTSARDQGGAAAATPGPSPRGLGPNPEENLIRDDPVSCPEGLGGKAMCPTVECTTNTITMYGTITCAKKKATRYCAQTGRAAQFEKELSKMNQWPIVLFRCAPAG